ncbi:MAG: DMT family transporter [Lachnospiraceae bacterium]|nr:DMT family transporter [Lachnospiraceae bacterium]
MRKVNWKNSFMLLVTAAIWGAAFVAQSVGMEYIGPFTFNCVRNIIGGLVLIPCIWFLDKWKEKENKSKAKLEEGKDSGDRKKLLTGGTCCGIALFLASNMQQIGIQYTTVGKAGFITALYIVIVPILGIFLKKKCNVQIWIGVIIAIMGFYLLSIKDGFRLEIADTYLLGSAVLFSVHILVIDYFSPRTNGVKMSCIQFFVCGILSGVVMFLVETPDLRSIFAAWMPVLYAGVLSCGVAYTLQIVGQKDFHPTIASLILSLESVFSVLAGWIILEQALTRRELLGCILIFCAIVLAQIPIKRTS